ncbi:MAG: NAD-dependent epimerase/dehydratase family protein [Candidatus Hydrothermarchaeota archaeon]
MRKKVLVTGGAGFVGSHLVDALVRDGEEVVVLDNLEYQVHEGRLPGYLNPGARYVFADVTDGEALERALEGCEVVFHEAAAVGVGQSMYQVEKYMRVNAIGTAKLLDLLVNREHEVEKLVVASSMSIYGEGKYECADCGVVYPRLRPREQLAARDWEVRCPTCGLALKPLPTDEGKPLFPTSIYAMSKRDQEEMSLAIGKAYGIPTVALRYFNIYGPRQALSNPYTGVCAIFSCRIRNDNPPVIFEDGLQSRDFVSVHDIVRANLLAMESSGADYKALNVGTGRPTSIREIAEVLIRLYGKRLEPEVSNKYREGDIRHCYADITAISALGFAPQVAFEEGMQELAEWVGLQPECQVADRFEKAQRELERRKLTL